MQTLHLLCPHNYANGELGKGGGLDLVVPLSRAYEHGKEGWGVIFHLSFLDITSIMNRLIIFLKLLLDNK